MTDQTTTPARRRGWIVTAIVLGVLITTGAVVNAFLAPPPKPAGTNNVVTGDFQRAEYPNVPSHEQSTYSEAVDRCQLSVGTYGAWEWTEDSIRLRFDLKTLSIRPDYDPSSISQDSPFEDSWPNRTIFNQMVKVGHSYRFGPATVKVLQVWNSPIPQYRRAYLKVTFDESQVLCPPPKTYTAG
ncbi:MULTISPECIES: hypothetical protein [unclassified Leifsonia]|uniref:hypothetical protein n=1 Tax=unclassified Leifsonia TaxID=2663824 RepID=UPI00037214D8|nr:MULTISPECIES: hypothetical protein [unclassified Leifsonia]TDP99420.1 hypothetical protein AXZ95_3339 [Leifsonia sp. 115AMFTsu3.1]